MFPEIGTSPLDIALSRDLSRMKNRPVRPLSPAAAGAAALPPMSKRPPRSTASCSSACSSSASTPTARASSTRCPSSAPEQVLAEYRAGTRPPGFRSAQVRRSALHAAAAGRRRVSHRAGPGRARAHRCAVEGARTQARGSAAVFVATGAAASLRGAGRALQRDLLLGLVLHDARAGGKRPARPDDLDARQLRVAHRPVRSRAERQSQLLPEPLAAAVLCRDGGARRAARRRRDVSQVPAAAAPRVRILDGGRRATLAPGAAHRRVVRLRDGTLLNRYWDDRDTPREEAYREDIATARDVGTARRRGLSQLAGRSGKRLGFRLTLARRRQDARDDSHHRFRAARSQQPAVSAGADDREGLRSHRRTPRARRTCRTRAAAAQGSRRARSCGTPRSARTPTTTGARRKAATAFRPRRCIRSTSS